MFTICIEHVWIVIEYFIKTVICYKENFTLNVRNITKFDKLKSLKIPDFLQSLPFAKQNKVNNQKV